MKRWRLLALLMMTALAQGETLRVGIEQHDYYPYYRATLESPPEGYCLDLLEAFAEYEGLTLELLPQPPEQEDKPLVWPNWRPVRAIDLPPERQRQLLDTHAALPRPSQLLDQLLSPEFINQASARQLAELVEAFRLPAGNALR